MTHAKWKLQGMNDDRTPSELEPGVIALGVVGAVILLGMILWLAA